MLFVTFYINNLKENESNNILFILFNVVQNLIWSS